MKCHVTCNIFFVAEIPAKLWALMGLFLKGRLCMGRVVVQFLVPFQELLLSKALITLITLEWLLVCVDQHVGLQIRAGRFSKKSKTNSAWAFLWCISQI